jgi:predicted nucleic acid-binding protein
MLSRQRLSTFPRVWSYLDAETDGQTLMYSARLTERFRLTLHDAACQEPAQRRKFPLATSDEDLISAGRALGITLLGR